jgi:very-short-patch-repair endonuclease
LPGDGTSRARNPSKSPWISPARSAVHSPSLPERSPAARSPARRLYPDIFVPAELDVDLELLSRAAALLVEPDGVVSGYSAAELHDASCAPPHAPAEVTVRRYRRPVPQLLVHRDSLDPQEVTIAGGLTVATRTRAAYDLVRRLPLTEGVVALDALAHKHLFRPDDIRAIRSRHLGATGSGRIEPALALMDCRADSPMESRIRVALTLGGIPPHIQHPVRVGGRNFLLDMAYPEAMLAVEFDGEHHRDAAQARRDLEREAALTAAGWKIIRFSAWLVMNRPDSLVAETRGELARRMSKIAGRATSRMF